MKLKKHSILVLYWFSSVIFVFQVFSQSNLHIFERNDRYGFADDSGQVIIEAQFHMAFDFNKEGIAAVVDDSGWVYIDKKGQHVIRPLVVDNGPDYFSEGLARYSDSGKTGFFDQAGNIVIPAEFDYAGPFSEERAVICFQCKPEKDGEYTRITGGRWGYIDREGTIVIPAEYDRAEKFLNGKARVYKDNIIFYIDKEGNRVSADEG
jgi:hypothetical protein